MHLLNRNFWALALICASPVRMEPNDLDSRIMRWRSDGYWWVSQRSRLCTVGGECSRWTEASQFLELTREDKAHREYLRYSFYGLSLNVRGRELWGSRRNGSSAGASAEVRLGLLRQRPLVEGYRYWVPSGPGLPSEEFEITIRRLKTRDSLPYSLDQDSTRACLELP